MERLTKWIEKIKIAIERIKYKLSHEYCYDKMEESGIAVSGHCCGVVGGDRMTDYTSDFCLDCPYYLPVNSEER